MELRLSYPIKGGSYVSPELSEDPFPTLCFDSGLPYMR